MLGGKIECGNEKSNFKRWDKERPCFLVDLVRIDYFISSLFSYGHGGLFLGSDKVIFMKQCFSVMNVFLA